jgi:DNA-directed RNA polymerase subunit K/omega
MDAPVAAPPSTRRVLTKFEVTKIIGFRAEQLARGAQPFVDVDDQFNPYELAKRELMSKRLPFVISRRLPDGKTEQIRVDELDVPPDTVLLN